MKHVQTGWHSLETSSCSTVIIPGHSGRILVKANYQWRRSNYLNGYVYEDGSINGQKQVKKIAEEWTVSSEYASWTTRILYQNAWVQDPVSSPDYSLLLMQSLKGSKCWLKYLEPCHPSTLPSPDCWCHLRKEPADSFSLFFK